MGTRLRVNFENMMNRKCYTTKQNQKKDGAKSTKFTLSKSKKRKGSTSFSMHMAIVQQFPEERQ